MIIHRRALFLLSLTACDRPKYADGECASDADPCAGSPYTTLAWSEEFEGPQPGEDPACFTRTPLCVVRLDWPGHATNCVSPTNFAGLADLDKCTWKLWDGYSFWGDWPNGGKLAYTPEQVSVSDGALHLSLRRRLPAEGGLCGPVSGADPLSNGYYGTDCAWVSGGIDSSGGNGIPGRNLKNGRLEIRARLPDGRGLYPALWTWASPAGGGSPYVNPDPVLWAGEYDLLESTTDESGRIDAFQTYHDWGFDPTSHAMKPSGSIFLEPGVWYTFAVERYDDRVVFSVDDCLTHEVEAGERDLRFNDLAQYVILNLAVENPVIDAGGVNALDGSTLDVDWVRVYEKTASAKSSFFATPGIEAD